MSYERAAEIFDDAKTHINARNNPVEWDLSSGLAELAHAISQDMAQIKATIAQMQEELRRLRK